MNGAGLLAAFPGIVMHDNVLAGYTGKSVPREQLLPERRHVHVVLRGLRRCGYRVLATAPLGSDSKRVGADVSRLPSRK